LNGKVERLKPEGAYERANFSLRSSNGEHDFKVFVRINSIFKENFSIGLMLNKSKKFLCTAVTLFRCNGPHGQHRLFPHHDRPHMHILDANDFEKEIKEPKIIEPTDAYSICRKEAMSYFCQRIGLARTDWPALKDFLPEPPNLFTEIDES
jgi:hypothetical protein